MHVDSGSRNITVAFIVSPIVSFGGGTAMSEFPDNANVRAGAAIAIAAEEKTVCEIRPIPKILLTGAELNLKTAVHIIDDALGTTTLRIDVLKEAVYVVELAN